MLIDGDFPVTNDFSETKEAVANLCTGEIFGRELLESTVDIMDPNLILLSGKVVS